MSVSVYQLFNEKRNPYKLKLLSGKGGLSREVSWAQVMEDEEYASFLIKNELIFTTGVGKGGSGDWLKSLIMTLIRHDASGLVINIGKYLTLDDIHEEILALCETHQFPLFTMPWCIRLADVLQAFLYEIFLTKQKEAEMISACKQLFFMQNIEENIHRLGLNGFLEHQSYQTVLFYAGDNVQDVFLGSYKFVLNKKRIPYILFPMNQYIAVLLQAEKEEESAAVIQELCCSIGPRTARHVGVGMAVSSLRHAAASYEQALCAVQWACRQHKEVQYFIDLGIYAVLFSQRNTLVIRELHDRYLGKLLQYDAEHAGYLFQTLESYLRHNGSIQAVAQETYVHRNTVSYRIRKIKQLIGCDLSDEHEKFTCMLACHIHHYLSAAAAEKTGSGQTI